MERFWKKVDKSGECWEWKAAMHTDGYGWFFWKPKGGPERAHRVSWMLHSGDIPEGMCVLHTCDNRKCVRPDHLFLGTKDDNNKDMSAKGRCARKKPKLQGEKNYQTHLTNQDVLDIRERASKGETQRGLASEYGINQRAVWAIIHKETWSHI